ncbi:MAG: hypothetical protein LBP28_08625 [Coriobacteriales bacterium]|nr:hypothetical protein [Coriobacteriales bacterium]
MSEPAVSQLICTRCNKVLEQRPLVLHYLGHDFNTQVLSCPICGLVYLDEQTVRERVTAVERAFEEK